MKEIYSIPGSMKGIHEPEINAMIDTWSNLLITKEQFQSTIYEIGVAFAVEQGLTNWIVDTSSAEGLFKKDVQEYIESTVAPKFAEIGIRNFFMVLPQAAIARLSAKNVSKINDGQEGMQTIQVGSVEEARDLIANR